MDDNNRCFNGEKIFNYSLMLQETLKNKSDETFYISPDFYSSIPKSEFFFDVYYNIDLSRFCRTYEEIMERHSKVYPDGFERIKNSELKSLALRIGRTEL